jgi:hypothetical protein
VNFPLAAILATHALVSPPDAGMSQWREALGREPNPAEISAALDELLIARRLAPDRTSRLMGEGALRLRAIRDPATRTRAMELFASPVADAGQAPDLQQLLHTTPGDNCPVCRLRAQPVTDSGL